MNELLLCVPFHANLNAKTKKFKKQLVTYVKKTYRRKEVVTIPDNHGNSSKN